MKTVILSLLLVWCSFGQQVNGGGGTGGGGGGGTISPASVDGATFYASQFAGADMGAKVNTAAAACNGGNSCKVMIPAGFYLYATGIVLPQSVVLEGVGPQSSWLSYTGTGTAILASGLNSQVRNLVVGCTAACAYFLNATGNSVVGDNLFFTGGTAASTVVGIHGANGNNVFTRIQAASIVGTLFQCDNSENNFISTVNAFGVVNNLTAIGLDFNSACVGLQVTDFQFVYAGLHGLIVRNTLTGGPPLGLFMTKFITDQSTGGTQWLFDSSLGGSADIFVTIDNSFGASAGKNEDTTIHTAAAKCVDIEGGLDISITNSRLSDCSAEGVYIGNAQASQILINGNFINNNNGANTASTNGVTIAAAVSGVTISGNIIGDLGGNNTGFQTYGIGVTSASASNIIMTGNNLSSNVTGPIINSMTSGYVYAGNIPTNQVAGCGTAVACAKLTTQAASITSTTVYTPPANGWYMVCMEQVITQSPTAAGNNGFLTVNYTSGVNNHAVFPTVPTGFPGNTGATVFTSNSGCMPIFAQASTAIQYAVGSYSAGTGTPMQYALNVTVTSLNPSGL